VEVEVNRIEKKIRWFSQLSEGGQSKLIGEVGIPDFLSPKHLFFMITIFKEGDQI
jgi:hypothetical protein